MKKLFFILFAFALLLSGLWIIPKDFSFIKTSAAQDISLSAQIELVNPAGPSYYVWLRFKYLTGFDHIKVFQDGEEAKFIPPKEYTDKTTGQKMILSGVTYPPSGTHQYRVVVYNSGNNILGEGTGQAIVPAGSYQASDNTGSPALPPFPPLKITDWTKGRFERGPGCQDKPLLCLLGSIINWGLLICSGFAVIAFIYSGIMYITAGGNPEQAERAKKNMVWAIIAVIVIALCFVLPYWLYDILSKGAPK